MIVEADHLKTLTAEKCITPQIMCAPLIRFVTVAIDLDDHAGGKPRKVSDVWPNWCFPAETSATESEVP